MTLIEAVQSAPACEIHRLSHECFRWTSSNDYEIVVVGGSRDDPDFYENDCVALAHADTCPACASSIADAVLVAARDNGEWVRAVPAVYLDVGRRVMATELRRRETETR